MGWIKRNLFFLIGSVIALALLGAAGYYLFTKNTLNNENKEKLVATVGELDQLNDQKPSPGSDKVDNTKAAKEQQKVVRENIARFKKYFQPIPPIPDGAELTDDVFAGQLRTTIEKLQNDAMMASAVLPPHYDFSFSTIKSKITFAPGSLPLLAAQLGEVKAICDVLFRAKINYLDSVRRVRVSADDRDQSAQAADYIEMPSVTNELAVMTPYELTFRCFSGELAGVLAGLASSHHGFRVKQINVERAAATSGISGESVGSPSAPVRRGGEDEASAPQATATAGTAAAISRGGLPTVLNEGQIKITLILELVKLKAAAK